ncbi:MAG: nicotinamide mononucleotide transporter [Verrucomicrobia bacterium]|jgi:nicotinamide mononucleotide transporter|nr:nicotinamide mononucleotide transporter [Verrucomicrobiota bacterium]
MSLPEIFGTILGVIGVGLIIRQSIWGWPVGLVQVSLSAWVFFRAQLYSDVILQGFFFVVQAYGWWHWWRGGVAAAAGLPVTRLSGRAIGGWVITGLAVSVVWGEFMRRQTDAALPHWDAFILVFSILAQWLQARKRLENWVTWMVVNVVAVGVYWAKDLWLFSGLYLLFLGMAVAGHVAWRKSLVEGRSA